MLCFSKKFNLQKKSFCFVLFCLFIVQGSEKSRTKSSHITLFNHIKKTPAIFKVPGELSQVYCFESYSKVLLFKNYYNIYYSSTDVIPVIHCTTHWLKHNDTIAIVSTGSKEILLLISVYCQVWDLSGKLWLTGDLALHQQPATALPTCFLFF